jgi:hypothetical protein
MEKRISGKGRMGLSKMLDQIVVQQTTIEETKILYSLPWVDAAYRPAA